MTAGEGRFFAWPGWRHWAFTAALSLAQGLWFLLVYGGADAITTLHSFRVRVHLGWEPQIPFVPASVLGYMSIYLLFLAAPFVLRTKREVAALAATLAAVTALAGVCFILLPVDNYFPPLGDSGAWAGLVTLAKRAALTYNWFPSLHVAMSVVCIAAYAPRARPWGKALLWSWAVAIGASTMLLHQHYLADVVTGFALGLAGYRWGFCRWTRGKREWRQNN